MLKKKAKRQTGYDSVTVKRLIEEFIADVQKNDENEDVELREEELAAVSGGWGQSSGRKAKTAKDEKKAEKEAEEERNRAAGHLG